MTIFSIKGPPNTHSFLPTPTHSFSEQVNQLTLDLLNRSESGPLLLPHLLKGCWWEELPIQLERPPCCWHLYNIEEAIYSNAPISLSTGTLTTKFSLSLWFLTPPTHGSRFILTIRFRGVVIILGAYWLKLCATSAGGREWLHCGRDPHSWGY